MIVVRQYGLLAPVDWGEDCQEHLFLQNRFWNRLVEIEQQHRAAYFALMAEDAAVAGMDAQIRALLDERAEVNDQRKQLRKAARKKVDTAVLDARMQEISDRIKVLQPQAKALRHSAREQAKPALAALEQARREQAKAARQQSGLWWGNYNAVAASYDIARQRAIKTGAELRFHRFDGSGRLTCQIQGGMTVDDLFAGKRSVVRVEPLDVTAFAHPFRGARRRAQRTFLTITVYTGVNEAGDRFRRTLRFPMILHRPIPADVLIKQVVVKRRRVGTAFRWSVTFTGQAPDVGAPETTSQTACGIDLGWRKVRDGLRVATIADHTGRVEYVVLPETLLGGFDHVENLQSRMDDDLNQMLALLKAGWADQENPPDALQELMRPILIAPRPAGGRLARLALTWRDQHADFAPNLWRPLEAWRKRNKRMVLERDNLRDKLLARRTDLYRNVALDIARRFAVIVLEDFDLRSIARLEQADGTENGLPAEVHKMRQRAAVSELRQWIGLQAAKTGAQIRLTPAKDSTRACHCCGHVNQGDRARLVWVCAGCGTVWDQDDNAALNLVNGLAEDPRAVG